MKPLRSEAPGESVKTPQYSSWSEKSREKPAWLKRDEDQAAFGPAPLSAQNMDPAAAQEFYRQQHESLLRDGNSSGTGAAAQLPDEARGFTAAGCVPFGLFGFFNGQIALGFIGLILCMIPVAELLYIFLVAFKGREYAWRGRHFHDMDEFHQVMEAWHIWGIGIWVVAKIVQIVTFANTGVVLR
jgi:hypothetical protein